MIEYFPEGLCCSKKTCIIHLFIAKVMSLKLNAFQTNFGENMDAQFKYCQKCGSMLPAAALVCPRCGAPAPGTFFFSPDPTVPLPAPAGAGRSARFWIGLAAIIGGSLCSCLALVMIVVYAMNGLKPSQSVAAVVDQPSETPSIEQPTTLPPAEDPAIEATEITLPTEEPLPAPSVTPDQPTPTETPPPVPPADAGATRYFDDFSNINGPWKQVFNTDYSMGYFQHGNYAITLNIPQKMAFSIPPYSFTRPVKNLIIKVKVTGDGGNGFYGLLCHFIDANNYYRVSFSDTQFAVDKFVEGKRSELTQPYWKPIIAYQPAADGYMNVILACTEGRIQLLVNDVGQVIVSDQDLSEGDAALFAASGDKKSATAVYEEAFFDDFSAELPAP